jgi:hypothetical protein
MTPLLNRMLPPSTGWLRGGRTPTDRSLPEIVLDDAPLYRSECFAEDLQSASDAALADLFPMLRARRVAASGR